MTPRPIWTLMLGLLPLLGGCAFSQVDAQGRTHVIGLVVLTLPPGGAANRSAPGAETWRLRTVGVSMSSSPVVGSSVVLGYSDSTQTWVRDNTVVAVTAVPQPDEEAKK
jgi:hypothetical protein